MDKLVIEGGAPLKGSLKISGAKNAALPIMAAALLTEEECTISNVPDLWDVASMVNILRELGMEIEHSSDGILTTKVTNEDNSVAPYELVSTMRASFCVLGPLLAKRGSAKVSLPGGCIIGPRPVDIHEKGLRALGADVETQHGYVVAEAKKLHGAEVYMGGPFGSTVLGTANVMMAATLAKGRTIIESAACEPEVQDLANFLIAMGAKISGIGTHRITIEGVEKLHGASHSIVPDRIETGTFLIASAITGGNIKIENARLDHHGAVIDALRSAGTKITESKGVFDMAVPDRFRAVDITTLPYPGFPTDMQAQLMVLLSIADGISLITEKIYPDRFMHVSELNRLGAKVRKEGPSAIINGVERLSGAPVMASDLRASAALVLAGLIASGTTEISRVYHIDRGYECIEQKLSQVGAKIKRVEED